MIDDRVIVVYYHHHTVFLVIIYRDYFHFDDARDEWAANKRRGPNGNYIYICGFRQKNHKLCQIACCDKIGLYSGCKRHFMWEEKQHKLL